jgi:hypothetical protein
VPYVSKNLETSTNHPGRWSTKKSCTLESIEPRASTRAAALKCCVRGSTSHDRSSVLPENRGMDNNDPCEWGNGSTTLLCLSRCRHRWRRIRGDVHGAQVP